MPSTPAAPASGVGGAVGRAAPPEKRSMALGLASAGGSAGQVLLVPLAQWVNQSEGMTAALIVLAGCVLLVAPLGLLLETRGQGETA